MAEEHEYERLRRELAIEIPLSQFVQQVADRAADRALEKHIANCPITGVRKRVEKLESSKTWTVGFVAGASAVGGMIGSVFMKVVGAVFKLFGP